MDQKALAEMILFVCMVGIDAVVRAVVYGLFAMIFYLIVTRER